MTTTKKPRPAYKLGTRVQTRHEYPRYVDGQFVGAPAKRLGTVRKQFLCDDGTYNYRVVWDLPELYTEWVTADTLELAA